MAMKFNAKLTKRTALGWAGMALIWTATTAQAQLIIDVYPSQDNPTKTLWIFRDSSTAHYGSSIRSSGNFHRRDSWKINTVDIYTANKPTNQLFNLAPLLSSTNNPKDIESITTRLAGNARVTSPFYSGLTFAANSTNAPTMTAGIASKTIGSIFMNDTANLDEIGIRGSVGGNLAYTNGQTIRWFGSGILNKPISDFNTTSYGGNFYSSQDIANRPFFVEIGSQIRLSHNRVVIPEPAGCAIVFGVFALLFVFVYRYLQKRGEQKS